jgi:hypothetical protein
MARHGRGRCPKQPTRPCRFAARALQAFLWGRTDPALTSRQRRRVASHPVSPVSLARPESPRWPAASSGGVRPRGRSDKRLSVVRLAPRRRHADKALARSPWPSYAAVSDAILEFIRRGVVVKTIINSMTFDGATTDPMQMAVRDALIAFMAATAQAEAKGGPACRYRALMPMATAIGVVSPATYANR